METRAWMEKWLCVCVGVSRGCMCMCTSMYVYMYVCMYGHLHEAQGYRAYSSEGSVVVDAVVDAVKGSDVDVSGDGVDDKDASIGVSVSVQQVWVLLVLVGR